MNETDLKYMAARIGVLEEQYARLHAEATVYRAALVWLMGVHQLGHEDANPRRAIVEPLGLDLDFQSVSPSGPVQQDERTVRTAQQFVSEAYQIFLSRQPKAP